METSIPFSGFYNSIHDAEFDRVWELECDYFYDETGQDMPEFLTDEFCRAIDWDNAHEEYAKAYVEAFLAEFGLKGEFSGMDSPREYNFSTDRVFAKLTRDDVARLFKMVSRDDLRKLAKERFTSRDGFISHYSPDLADWGKVSDWDHNQIGTLVLCAMQAEGVEEHELVEDLNCNGDIDNWVWGSSKRATRLANIIYYMRQRGQRSIRTMAQWHEARRAENRPFSETPLGNYSN